MTRWHRIVMTLLLSLSLSGCAVAVPVITAAVGIVDRWMLGKKIERLEQKIEGAAERPGDCLARPCATP